MTEKNYPDVIYCNDYNIGEMNAAERAYDLGFRDGRSTEHLLNALKPLAGWSNLTAAIADGARIDWEAMDGLEAKCVHPELGTLTYKLERNASYRADKLSGWGKPGIPVGWMGAFVSAWDGESGWSLWVKGDLPLRKLTADELEPGTIFEAVLTDEEEFGPATLLRVDAGIIDTGDWQKLDVDLTCIEVSRVLGTFQAPEGDA